MNKPPDAYNDAYVAYSAHSYGTTTTGEALVHSQTKVNSVVFNGSAGVTDDTVIAGNKRKLQIEKDSADNQNLYYMHSPWDWLAVTGTYGGERNSPRTISWAQEIKTDAFVEPDGTYHKQVSQHPVSDKQTKLYDWSGKMPVGYYTPDAATAVYNSRASLSLPTEPTQGILAPYYTVESDQQSAPVRIHLSENDFTEDGRVKREILEKMAASQGYKIEDNRLVPVASGK